MVEAITIVLIIAFLVGIGVAYWFGRRAGAFWKHREWEDVLMPGHRKDAIQRSRSVIGGHFSEQLAPFLPNFKYLPTECKFLGKPIDFIVFKGMDGKEIKEVVFVEVKSGNSRLSSQEKNLKEAIEGKKVKWVEYRIPEELTKKRDIDVDGLFDEEKK
jgi:predicted Holliday junction resolvase-like endonuclease